MSNSPLRQWAATGVIAGIAIAVAVVLYQRSTPVALDRHASVVDGIRRMQRADADLQAQVLSVRFGLLRQYDGLAQTMAELEGLVDEVEQGADVVLGKGALEAESAALRLELVDRRRELERFKREAAILRNSLYYLPLAGERLEGALRRSPVDSDGVIASEVSALVGRTLVYNLLGGRATLQGLRAQLERTRSMGEGLPSGLASDFGLFVRHATVIADQLGIVGALLDSIRGRAFTLALQRLDSRYGATVLERMSMADEYRLALYGWSVILLGLVAVAGYKLRQLYANLEALVAERTSALKEALDQLWGEMRLARKIQTALLPACPVLEGFEVAATMRPAEEVGGDYYDLFRAGGNDWVVIGDVSGHGVPSGLVMMMCQTAIRTAATTQPDLRPDALLSVVNEPLTENIERLGDGRYMTITALRSEGDGTLLYAGMHQDLVVYRAASHEVERIETEGMWLGLRRDIGSLQTSREVHLDPGDVLVLYTDGLTEARRGGAMLEVDAIESTLRRSGTSSAEDLLFALLENLEGAEVRDDVAAIVIRRLSVAPSVDAATERAAP